MVASARPRSGWLVHEAVVAQARERPYAEALVSGGRSVSYRELERASAGLAQRLRARGVGPEVRVGLIADRAAGTIIGMLGILRAGAAFVPIDPTYPRRRVESIVADGIGLVVGDGSAAGDVPGTPLVRLEDARDGAELPGADEPDLHPDNAAYVIYTSGSTGRPKGVVNTHRGIAASTHDRQVVYAEPVDTFLLLSSVAFDSSLAGIFWTLTCGGRLVIPSSVAELDAQSIVRQIRDRQVTHLLALPRLYRVLLGHAAPGDLGSLRVAIVAGEPWPHSLVELHRAAAPGTALFSEWGVTEASVWSTVCDTARAVSSPLGVPIPSAELYLLDEWLREVPVGATGEVYVAGPGLARGYLHQPGLTAQRFVPHPFAGGGQRLYRTGDLARRLSGGDLQFVGRADDQVKINGFRVEVGEVEAAIRELPSVADAAVSVERRGDDHPVLTAYVVPASGARPDRELRRHLGRVLPAYAVPARLTVVPALPRLPNGKLDRRALPGLRLRRTAAVSPEPAPDGVEARLLAIWRQVFHDESVIPTDDFFALGGDSLAAMQIVSRIRSELDVYLQTDTVFDAPTIPELAALIVRRRGGEAAYLVPWADSEQMR